MKFENFNKIIITTLIMITLAGCESKEEKENMNIYNSAVELYNAGEYEKSKEVLDKVGTNLKDTSELSNLLDKELEKIKKQEEIKQKNEDAKSQYYDIVAEIKNGDTKNVDEEVIKILDNLNYKESRNYYKLYAYKESLRYSGYPGVNKQLHPGETNKFIGYGKMFKDGMDMYRSLMKLGFENYVDKNYFIEVRLVGKYEVGYYDASLQPIVEGSMYFNSLLDTNIDYYDYSDRNSKPMLFDEDRIVYKDYHDYKPVFKVELDENDLENGNYYSTEYLVCYDENGNEVKSYTLFEK